MKNERKCDECKTGVMIVITSRRLVAAPYQRQTFKCKQCGYRVTKLTPAEKVWRRDL